MPAKNEADRLPRTLAALANQTDPQGRPWRRERWEVLLLVNNSTDDSFALARQFKWSHPAFPLHVAEQHFPAEQAHIGHVRKVLMDTACQRLLLQPKASSLLLSTDADTEVAPDWLTQNLAEARRGAEAVGGRILLQPQDLRELHPRTRNIQLGSDQYHLLVSWLEDCCDPQAHDPWPRHHQHFGSSFALKPEIYRHIGGLPPKEFLEDVALYEALIRQDVKFRHSPAVRVRTSGRLQGRTAVGLAEQLSVWSRGGPAVTVPSVVLLRTLFLLRNRLRVLWRRIQAGQDVRQSTFESLSRACGMGARETQKALACQWFGAAFNALRLRERLERAMLPGEARQPLEEAVRQLQEQFSLPRCSCPTVSAAEVQSGIGAP